MTLAQQPQKLTATQARAATDIAQQKRDDYIAYVTWLFNVSADEALGYSSWADYMTVELPMFPKMISSDRGEAARQLSNAGMSQREIGATLGVDHRTVGRDLSGANAPERSTTPEVVPEPVPDPWTADEKQMKKALTAGGTVVGSLRGNHARLIEWANNRDCTVRVDRRTVWGNPFELPGDGDRGTVIHNYEQHYLPYKPGLLAALPTLRGKLLLCWCAPDACHGDVLKKWSER